MRIFIWNDAFFSPRFRGLVGEGWVIHSLPVLVSFLFSFSRDRLCTPVSLSRPGSVHSGSASWDFCGWVFLDLPRNLLAKLSLACELCIAHPDSVGSSVCAYLGITWYLHFGQTDQGLLSTAVTGGSNWHQIRISTQSQLGRRKFSCWSCGDLNMQPFDDESGALPTSCWSFVRI